jgi:hypothetical protein
VKNAASKPVDGPDHQDVEGSPHRLLEHSVKGRTLIPALGPADALVFVVLDNHPSTVFRHPSQDEPLVLGGLIVAADTEIDRRTVGRSRQSIGVADFCGFLGVCGRWVFCMGLHSALGWLRSLPDTSLHANWLPCHLSPGATLGGSISAQVAGTAD